MCKRISGSNSFRSFDDPYCYICSWNSNVKTPRHFSLGVSRLLSNRWLGKGSGAVEEATIAIITESAIGKG